ncbi:MAG: ribonuclease HIII [Polyangia bacterium]|mgnify:CR=1 FL=1|jgi:ribonuclease HIII|nr:ribonuclease HIII [Polyangia bacterium]
MAPHQPSQTFSLDPLNEPKLRAVLIEAGFALEDAPHAFWRGRGPGCIATMYRSGKLVLQGVNAPTLAAVLGLAAAEPPEPEPARSAAIALAKHPEPKPDAWIGSDEVGKGDYFGPLVVVAARVERDQVPLLMELGVADSKTLGDSRMTSIAKDLRRLVPHRSVVVSPEAYNRLHSQLGNLNFLLAWAHSRALEDLLAEAPATYALVDRFADERVLRRRLGEAARRIQVEQRPKAEEDPAVAAASILARTEFLRRMEALSREAGFTLPRGAGPPVIAAGRRLLAEKGMEALGRFAKVHFRTTEDLRPR